MQWSKKVYTLFIIAIMLLVSNDFHNFGSYTTVFTVRRSATTTTTTRNDRTHLQTSDKTE